MTLASTSPGHATAFPPVMARSPSPHRRGGQPGLMLPTRERCRQDSVVVVAERDPEGWPVAHYRAIDTVARLLRCGLIEPGWAAAGDRFRRDFHAARFDPLSAGDLRRPRGAGGRETISDRAEDARQRVYEALGSLGGMSAPAGSVIWHVVGNEASLRDWALRQIWGGGRSIRHEVATGILVAALGSLASYYDRPRRAARDNPATPSSPGLTR